MPTKGSKILIADDHPILLKGLFDFLLDLGFRDVFKASNGIEALDLIQQEKPNLAILDLEMPEMTGLEIAAACKSSGIPTKIILLTLHKEIYLYQQAKDLNLSGYILKDFALEDLSNAIRVVLDGGEFFSEKIFDGIKDYQSESADYNLTSRAIFKRNRLKTFYR